MQMAWSMTSCFPARSFLEGVFLFPGKEVGGGGGGR